MFIEQGMVDCVKLGCENIHPMFTRAVESGKTEGFLFSCYCRVQYTSELSVAMWCCAVWTTDIVVGAA